MMKFWKQKIPPTIQELLEQQLYQAQVESTEARMKAEHWTAMSNVLCERVNWLKTQIILEKGEKK
jgi:hypothetical protein